MGAKTFYHSMKPLLIISKLLGLAIFKFGQDGYEKSNLNVFFNITASIIYANVGIYSIYLRIESMTSSVLMTTTAVLQLISATVQVIIVWIFSAFLQKKHIKLLCKLEEIGKKFQNLGVWIYYDSKQRLIYYQIIIRTVTILISVVTQITIFQFGRSVPLFIFYFAFYFPVIINSGICQMVSIYIAIIKEDYKILNEHLMELQQQPEKATFTVQKLNTVTLLKSKLSMLKIIAPLHHELNKAVHKLNDTFGVILLATFGVTFVVIIVNLYYFIVLLQRVNEETLPIFIAAVSNCMPYILDGIFICYLCHSASNEANMSGSLIHRLESNNKEVKEQVELFSLQLAHEKVEFNASGFFPIDYTLIFSIIGGVTTNLVILIQFSTSSSQ